ncbi:hypothetical protein CK203_016853 [Vitis vinifera]|uniref:Uncharacterized protein n=1 Tax=Vitis vinifera TaxID=29760 RepID=A0A438JNB3_VITVI|nr:hypothetical protein CK203_016853 [Vitis vinifera]
MAALLKQVSCFTETEPLLINMVNFFPLTKQVLADLGGNPLVNVAAQLSYGTPESIVSRIQPMQDYSAHETKKCEELCSKLAKTNGDLPTALKVAADRVEALRKTEGEREMA